MSKKTNGPNPLIYGGQPAHKHYDQSNSTTTPLAASATFTGTKQLNTSPGALVTVKTDQAGTLHIDLSDDGTNWEASEGNSGGYAVAANTYEEHTVFKNSRYIRVRFTNTSGSPQTFLRLHTYYGEFGSESSKAFRPVATADVPAGVAINAAASTTVLSARGDRRYVALSVTGDTVWVKLQAASTDNDKKGIRIPAGTTYEFFPELVYTGEISAISDSTSATIYATEF